MTLSTQDLAAAIGISRQRVNELGRKGKIQREPDGRWDRDKVRTALGRNLDTTQISPARGEAPPRTVGRRQADRGPAVMQEPSQDTSPARGSLAAAQLMKARAEATIKALEARRLEKKLLDADEVADAVSGMISAVKAKLLVLADELCDRLAAETRAAACREMVEQKVHEALEELAEYPGEA